MTTTRPAPVRTRRPDRTAGPRAFITACMWLGIAGPFAGLLRPDWFPVGPIAAADAVVGGLAVAVGCLLILRAAGAVGRSIAAAPPLRHVTDAERDRLGRTPNWKDSYDR